MILFGWRRDNLRENVLEYLKNKLDEKSKYEIGEMYDYFDNHGEQQMCEIDYILFEEGYLVFYTGELNNSQDYCEIDSLSTDTLCNIADKVHIKDLK